MSAIKKKLLREFRSKLKKKSPHKSLLHHHWETPPLSLEKETLYSVNQLATDLGNWDCAQRCENHQMLRWFPTQNCKGDAWHVISSHDGLKVEKMALHRGSNANMSRKARLKAHLDGKPQQLCHSGKDFCLDGCLRNMNEVCSFVVRVFWEMSCATRYCSASFFAGVISCVESEMTPWQKSTSSLWKSSSISSAQKKSAGVL